MAESDATKKNGSANHPARWSARVLAWAALTIPRFSPMKIGGRFMRKRLISHHGARPIRAVADDGAPIDALFFKRSEDCGRRLPVIVNHGYVETKEFHMGEVSLLREHGHDVVLYDLRGHGRSGGRFTTLGVKEVGDLRSLIDCCAKDGLISDKVITLGYSTGAAVVLQHAATDDRVAATVALTPFADMTAAVRSFRKLFGQWYDEEQLLRGFEHVLNGDGAVMAASDTVAALPKINVPVFMAVGDGDRHLPQTEHMDKLIAAARADAMELHIVPQRNHVSIYRHMTDALKEQIVTFCDRVSTS